MDDSKTDLDLGNPRWEDAPEVRRRDERHRLAKTMGMIAAIAGDALGGLHRAREPHPRAYQSTHERRAALDRAEDKRRRRREKRAKKWNGEVRRG